MGLSWCVDGVESFSYQTNGEAICLLHTIILPLPSVILVLSSLIRLRQLQPFRSYPELDPITLRHFKALVVCFVLMIALTISANTAIAQNISYSQITDCTIQVLGWMLCLLLTTKECYRITIWPGILVKFFLACSLVCLIALAIFETSESNGLGQIIQLCASFFVLVVANLVALLKDYVVSADDLARMEMDRVSVLDNEFDSYSKGLNCCGISLCALTSDDLEANEPFLNKHSISSIQSSGDVSMPVHGDQREGSKSAMERNLSQNTRSEKSKSLLSSILTRAFSFSEEDAFVGVTDANGNTNRSNLGPNDSMHTRSTDNGTVDTVTDNGNIGSGKALQRVLRQQKARSAASDPGLAPRGLLDSASSSTLPLALGQQSSSSGSMMANSRSYTRAEQQHGEYWKVIITRWAMRRSRLQSADTDDQVLGLSMREHGGAQASKQIQSSTSPMGTIDVINSGDKGVLESGSRVLGGLEGEVEYEMILQEVHAWLWSSGRSNFSSADVAVAGTSSAVNTSVSNQGGGLASKQQAKKWVVWRSAAEVLALHSQLLSVFGDLAPRKPHLRTAVKTVSTYSLLQSDISNDMKTIAVYVTALLRSAQFLSLPQVRAFVQLEIECLPSSFQLVALGTSGNTPSILVPITASALPSAPMRDWSDSSISQPLNADEEGAFSTSRQSFVQLGGYNSGFGDDEVDRESMVSRPGGPSDSIQGKWRKVFLNMRVKLKPHEIAIRTRLFVGVISGAEISSWLMKHYCSELVAAALEGSDQSTSQQDAFKHAQDRGEACAIGQELLNCGLLVPICRPPGDTNNELGSRWHRDADDDNEFQELLAQSSGSNLPPSRDREGAINPEKESGPIFSDYPCYLYRFPARSATAGGIGSFTLFGAPVAVTIPEFAALDENDEGSGRAGGGVRDTTVLTLGGGSAAAVKRPSTILASIAGSTGTVEYLVNVRHSDEEWQIWKRFSDFKEFNKQLGREGIRPEISFPSSSFGTLGGTSLYETRRAKLELFMNSALEAVVQSGEDVPLKITAQFLDDEFNDLVIL